MNNSDQKEIRFSDFDDPDDSHAANKDIEKITQLWKQMKESKKNLNLTATSQSINKLMSAKALESSARTNQSDINQQQQQQQQSQSQYQLEDKRSQQSQSKQKDNMNSSNLLKKMSEAEEELERCHDKIAKLVQQNQQQQSQINQLNDQLIETLNNNQLVEKQEDIQKQNQNQDNEYDYEKQIEILNQINKEIEEKYDLILQEKQQLEEENLRLNKQLQNKNLENERIKDKLDQVEKCIDEIYLEKQSKGTILMEVDYLKSDIERLLTLLKTTSAFRSLCNYADDCKSIRYLRKMPQYIANQVQQSKRYFQTNKGQIEIVEKLLWVPTDSYQYLQQLSQKYSCNLTEEHVEELLLGLNQIWMNREQITLNKTKQKYEQEIANLRKILNQHLTYDEITSKRKISRLKGELYKAKKEKENVQIDKSQKDQQLTNQQQKSNVWRIIKECEEELLKKSQEIEQIKVQLFDSQRKNTSYDKIIYMDGALWIMEKVLKEVEKFRNSVNIIIQEFNEEISNLGNQENQTNINKMYKYLTDRIDRTTESLLEKLVIMTERINQDTN